MKNQFFYTRKEMITTPQENGEMLSEEKTFTDSINVNKIIRSVRIDNDNLIVLLDDMHERTKEVPNINLKTNKVIGTKKQTEIYKTEVYLTGEDIERFYKLTNIE